MPRTEKAKPEKTKSPSLSAQLKAARERSKEAEAARALIADECERLKEENKQLTEKLSRIEHNFGSLTVSNRAMHRSLSTFVSRLERTERWLDVTERENAKLQTDKQLAERSYSQILLAKNTFWRWLTNTIIKRQKIGVVYVDPKPRERDAYATFSTLEEINAEESLDTKQEEKQ